jgi:hypothetical protein
MQRAYKNSDFPEILGFSMTKNKYVRGRPRK